MHIQFKRDINKIILITVGCVCFLSSIFSKAHASENVKFIRDITAGLSSPLDVAVSDAGDIYVVDEDNSSVSIYESNGDFKKFFGEKGKEEGQFKRPGSIDVSSKGKVIVADTGNNRIQVFNRAGEFLFQFGTSGSAPGQFRDPSGVTVDHFGMIYVADKDNKRIQVFSPNGIFLRYFSVASPPMDLGVDSECNLYVLMPEKKSIVKYTSYGKRLQDISCVMDKKDCLERATGLRIDEKGDFYITESSEDSIKKFDNNERVLISFGSHGEGRGQFDDARGITSDEDGYLYIADSLNSRVQVLKIAGSEKPSKPFVQKNSLILDYYTSVFVKKGIVDIDFIPGRGFYAIADEEKYIFCSEGNQEKYFGMHGRNPGEFYKPKALGVTLTGKMLVVDSGNNRVQFITPDKKMGYQFGKPGRKAGHFSSPEGIAINSKGEIYVADTMNNRLQVFTLDGIYLRTISTINVTNKEYDMEDFELRLPKSIAMNSKDEIYILDSSNNRVILIDEYGRLLRIIENNEEGINRFGKIIDIALDENDNLYIADQGNYRIQIFDSNGNFWEAFGSVGKGGGYFQKISAVAASEGKVYVADYLEEEVEVFRFVSRGLNRKERFYVSKTGTPPEDSEKNEVFKYGMAKKQALKDAIKEFKDYLKVSDEEIKRMIRIEAVEVMNDNRVQVTVSMPRNVSREVFPS